ncbi:MAG: hypothetical protein DBP02_17750 [gamma proteobacterium symbiont of Ctena orbiculata]|nr:MAG: hypothetical protein DBP02_17750 [gamma proteobacterium symbiont of Ctena orbiculata]
MLKKGKDMVTEKKPLSFYFFDVDDNIVFLSTPIYVLNVETGKEKKVSTGEFARIHPFLEQPGRWEDFRVYEKTFREFRDIPAAELEDGQEQYFVRDIKKQISDRSNSWQAPSWNLFVHACNAQRPLSFVTARGHHPDTIKAGVEAIQQAGFIEKTPNYLSVFPVGNDEVRKQELDDPNLMKTTPRLKKTAIIKSIEKAIEEYGDEYEVQFGMSDDDPANVNLIISAMRDCKLKYPERRFFVINTHYAPGDSIDQRVKLEVFEYDQRVD